MSRDNKKNLDQFCRKLGAIVYEILDSSDELLSIHEELLYLYRPKLQEEANKFIGLRFVLPDSVGLLCVLRKLFIPDDDEFYDSVAPLRDIAFDVATRMVSADVIINDIITMYTEPHDEDMYIHLYFAVLNPISNSIRYMREKLDKLHKETSKVWPNLIVSDDDTVEVEDEETILPIEVENFQIMRSTLVQAFIKYINEHESEQISDFFADIQDYLVAFANGIEPDEEFDFGFVLETCDDETPEIQYIDFQFESEMLQISSGGCVSTEFVGSDSYTNWIYSIGRDGWDHWNRGSNNYFFSTLLDLVHAGAKLSIYSPDEYIYDEEDE